MTQPLQQILSDVASGRLATEEAARQIRNQRHEDLSFATLDHDRTERCGHSEVIFAEGKTADQVVRIAESLMDRNGQALITRAGPETSQAVLDRFGDAAGDRRTMLVGRAPEVSGTPIPVITAGTSDQPVAVEAEWTARSMGQDVRPIRDVGVAGLGRLLNRLEELKPTGVIVCIAGMEGALPSVVGGLVDVPVLAVPTSVGYGANFGGIAALLGMLNSCAAGVSVLNIDNGFGAGYSATLIQKQFDGAASE